VLPLLFHATTDKRYRAGKGGDLASGRDAMTYPWLLQMTKETATI